MSRKGQSITLSVSEADKQQLETLAEEFGMKWGDKPNISKLITAIAKSHLQIVRNNNWSQERLKALDNARKALIDRGDMAQAQDIARIISSRSELSPTLKREIEAFLDNPQPVWRQRIDQLIAQEQPFRLIYRDAAERQWTYTVLFAKILPIEERQYLVCRCLETEGNQDIPELSHNWTLRLDRILEAAVTPIEQPWADLQLVSVTFYLSGGLAFGYRNYKPGDKFVGEIEGNPPKRRVIRDIYSTFWFLRKIRKYGKDCTVVAPQSVRDRFKEELKSWCQNYDLKVEDAGD